jgi:hypothetical protein
MRYSFTEKTGIKTTHQGVTICDLFGLEVFTNVGSGAAVVNCPAGTWDIFGDFTEVEPVNYRPNGCEYPKKQRNVTRKINTFFEPNKNKATINLKNGSIKIDLHFWMPLNQAQKDFVLLHEYGHFYYDSEPDCDYFAAEKMLEMGYNPSTISVAKTCLESKERNEKINHFLEEFKR